MRDLVTPDKVLAIHRGGLVGGVAVNVLAGVFQRSLAASGLCLASVVLLYIALGVHRSKKAAIRKSLIILPYSDATPESVTNGPLTQWRVKSKWMRATLLGLSLLTLAGAVAIGSASSEPKANTDAVALAKMDSLERNLTAQMQEIRLLMLQVAPGVPYVDAVRRTVSPELLERAKALTRSDDLQREIVLRIVSKKHLEADELIRELEAAPLAKVCEILTLKGDNWYQAGEIAKAIDAYEQAFANCAYDLQIRRSLAAAHSVAQYGDVVAHRERAVQILEKSLGMVEARSREWALTKVDLAAARLAMPLADPTSAIDRAVAETEDALTVLTRTEDPLDWAKAHVVRSSGLRQRVSGDRSVDLHLAIESATAAPSGATREGSPAVWAQAHANAGMAWASFPAGNDEYLKNAISEYELALTVFSRAAYPFEWAVVQTNLGLAWQKLLGGDPTEQGECAIAAHERSLEVLNRDRYQYHWAIALMNLGVALVDRRQGNRADNCARAIACFEQGSDVITSTAYPVESARLYMNLGRAWAANPVGGRDSNCQRALDAFSRASALSDRRDRVLWAKTQMHTAAMWGSFAGGVREDNLDLSIYYYEQALTELRQETGGVEWAGCGSNLGSAWARKSTGDRDYNLSRAIDAFELADAGLSRQTNPAEWLVVQINLGLAWGELTHGDRASNLERSIAAYERARSVCEMVRSAQDCAALLSRIGTTYEALGRTLNDDCSALRRAVAYQKAALGKLLGNLDQSTIVQKQLADLREHYEYTECAASEPFEGIEAAQ